MSDDDLLRSALEREIRSVPIGHDAHEVLAALEPAFRRATVKRTMVIAASTVLVLGGTVAAFDVVRPTEDEISIVSPVTVTSEPGSTETIRTGSIGGDEVPTTLDDSSTIHSPIEISGDDDPERTDPIPTVPAVVTSSTPATTGGSEGGVDPATPPTTPEPGPTSVTPPAAPPTSPTPPPTSTTVPPSGQQLTRYDSTCGSVIADLATSPPTIVEIVVTTGYRYRVEDPDGNSITVQFTGPGEDCEVKVGTPPDEGHAERSVPDDAVDG